jgi:hypothetical protein
MESHSKTEGGDAKDMHQACVAGHVQPDQVVILQVLEDVLPRILGQSERHVDERPTDFFFWGYRSLTTLPVKKKKSEKKKVDAVVGNLFSSIVAWLKGWCDCPTSRRTWSTTLRRSLRIGTLRDSMQPATLAFNGCWKICVIGDVTWWALRGINHD